ncbi:hypothetical protein [Humisphaera borealis]|uniref:PQ-loop repeat-containing protein n=1 Tax=Humisphaera borealis TaxID=2807512 RepID=A0A7M2WV87_9BACT|nr:hypothetical protein [Humisphaera borealis]QOV89299.1 hypothetical protein IPV69_24335 [Humisphaera borealis]
MTDALGWGSSIILLLTITRQIFKQWTERSCQGVSVWLYAGQLAASCGFTLYSYQVGNWVFVITNGLMAVSAIIGWSMVRHFRCLANRQGIAER